MEGVHWYTRTEFAGTGRESVYIYAEFDGRTRRVAIKCSSLLLLRCHGPLALALYAVEQMTLSIKATREAAAKQRAYSELH